MSNPRTPPAWRRAFLRALARSGNVTMAARACGLDPSYPYQTRRRNAAFAASWERALLKAQEKLSTCEGRDLSQDGALSPETPACAGDREALSPREGGDLPPDGAPLSETPACAGDRDITKKGGAKRPVLRPDEIVRDSKAGHPKIVRVKEGRWSAKAEAAFLAELTATANVTAAARAAGVTLQCVYMRRKLYPAFRAEWAAAVAEGFARIETLVVCAATTTLQPEPLPDRAWEEPLLTPEQALKVWLTHRAGGPGARKQSLGGMPRREPDIEEVRQEILRKVAAMERAELWNR